MRNAPIVRRSACRGCPAATPTGRAMWENAFSWGRNCGGAQSRSGGGWGGERGVASQSRDLNRLEVKWRPAPEHTHHRVERHGVMRFGHAGLGHVVSLLARWRQFIPSAKSWRPFQVCSVDSRHTNWALSKQNAIHCWKVRRMEHSYCRLSGCISSAEIIRKRQKNLRSVRYQSILARARCKIAEMHTFMC